MNTENNKKAQYTKRLLSNTLVSLMKQFSYEEITILNICQYAEVSRASFYRNFKNKEEVLEFYIQSIVEKKIPDESDASRMFFKSEESIFVWYDEREILKLLYDNQLFYIFTNQLNKIINKAVKLRIEDKDDPYHDYLATEMSYIISSIFYKWTERGFKENKTEMSELLNKLHLSRARRELLGW